MPADFIDSNVLLYVALKDDPKARQAEAVIARGGIVSVQVLNEIANVVRRKRTRSWPEVVEFLAAIRRLLEVRSLTVEDHVMALAVSDRYRLSIYDAMIVASALAAGCAILWSEDMHDGLVVEGALTIRNPFA